MKRIGCLVLFLCCVAPAWADVRLKKGVHTCTVKRIFDGDQVGCLMKVGRVKDHNVWRYFNHRLAGIDAPERRTQQPFWRESQRGLAELLPAGTSVTILVIGYDARYKRNLVTVTADRVGDAGEAQIKAGAAWFYRRYARSLPPQLREQYAAAEMAARLAKRGLWADAQVVSPWSWRRGGRTATAQ